MDLGHLTTLFCEIDDFCVSFEPVWFQTLIEANAKVRKRTGGLRLSEIMTLIIGFQFSHFRNFKKYYLTMSFFHRKEFPGMPCYERFVSLMKTALVPLFFFFMHKNGKCDGVSFMDATKIEVCHPKRVRSHKVFDGLAKLGKTTMGWFFGFKFHFVINGQGEILSVKLTPGNCDDRGPVPDLARSLVGKLFADKGYICRKLFKKLLENGLKLITPIKRNMKPQIMPRDESILLQKRSLIESVINQLKTVFHLQHTRHRSVWNFMVNLVAVLCAYCLYDRKACLNVSSPAPAAVLSAM